MVIDNEFFSDFQRTQVKLKKIITRELRYDDCEENDPGDYFKFHMNTIKPEMAYLVEPSLFYHSSDLQISPTQRGTQAHS